MKQLKLSGRELAVLRSIDYASGSTGTEIRERTAIDGSDLVDILNGLAEVGYVETFPLVDPVTTATWPVRSNIIFSLSRKTFRSVDRTLNRRL